MQTINPSPLFRGELVRLTALLPEDKDAFARWSADAEYQRLLDLRPARPRGPESVMENTVESGEKNVLFGIRTLAEDKLIGFGELDPNRRDQYCWLGIGIGNREYWGKGYGTDAVRLLVAYAFRELNLYRVSLSVFEYNERAIRAYEKAGFVHEGRQRATIYRDGQRFDMLMMGILRPDWFAQMGLTDALYG